MSSTAAKVGAGVGAGLATAGAIAASIFSFGAAAPAAIPGAVAADTAAAGVIGADAAATGAAAGSAAADVGAGASAAGSAAAGSAAAASAAAAPVLAGDSGSIAAANALLTPAVSDISTTAPAEASSAIAPDIAPAPMATPASAITPSPAITGPIMDTTGTANQFDVAPTTINAGESTGTNIIPGQSGLNSQASSLLNGTWNANADSATAGADSASTLPGSMGDKLQAAVKLGQSAASNMQNAIGKMKAPNTMPAQIAPVQAPNLGGFGVGAPLQSNSFGQNLMPQQMSSMQLGQMPGQYQIQAPPAFAGSDRRLKTSINPAYNEMDNILNQIYKNIKSKKVK